MHVLRIVDLVVYFLAGMLLVLFVRSHVDRKREEPPNHPRLYAFGGWLIAISVGGMLVGLRLIAMDMNQSHALRILARTQSVPGADLNIQ